jgi:hypothetical protein
MHNGGRRAHRLRVAVARLDERFRAATVDKGADVWHSAPWWQRREVVDLIATKTRLLQSFA